MPFEAKIITSKAEVKLDSRPADTAFEDRPAGEGGPNAGPICKAISGGSWNWQLRYNAPGSFMGFQFNAGGFKWISVQQKLNPGEWYHITGTYDGSDAVCYLNGVETERISMPAINSSDDDTPFSAIDPILEASDSSFDSGGMSNAGISYIDNIVVGETESDLRMSVEPADKLATCWGDIKSLSKNGFSDRH